MESQKTILWVEDFANDSDLVPDGYDFLNEKTPDRTEQIKELFPPYLVDMVQVVEDPTKLPNYMQKYGKNYEFIILDVNFEVGISQLQEDINEMSFAAIGKRLRMTKQQAERLYDCHYSILCSRMLGEIVKITGDSGICGRYLWVYNIKKGKKGYDCLVNEYPEICKDLIKPQNGVNKVKGYRFGHL